jgi:hypothetical protein
VSPARRELPNELDVLRDVSKRFVDAGIPFMLTGSLAMNFYAMPRMTRDIDLVVALTEADVERLVTLLEDDYYVSREAIEEAIKHASSFNLIHRAGIVKVDCFPRKPDPYHITEFGRRRLVALGEFSTYLTTREDLILSKLLWAKESRSEVQLEDVRNLAAGELDEAYVDEWVRRLNVADLWGEVRP